jgi:hypothetical protein
MPSQEEIDEQLQLLIAHRRRLSHLLMQVAKHGTAYVPPAIAGDIDEARADIASIKGALRRWGESVEDLPGELEPKSPQKIATAAEERARTRYLKWLAEDVDNRLKVSIHQARFVDLGLTESRSATRPWAYRGYLPGAPPQSFERFEEAFEQYHRRVLLLGAPGAGKTTTLLDTVQKLTREALADPDAPIPLLINLSRWRGTPQGLSLARQSRLSSLARPHKHEARQLAPADTFAEWLIERVADLPGAGVSAEIARAWLDQDRVALLLDGLDELDQGRVDLVLASNAYLKAHPETPIVVCSRIVDYAALQANHETRLFLDGTVTLQPLTHEQINDYLIVSGATALREALAGDAELYELAQTPLTLSMMTLAYGGLPPTAIPGNLSLSERRRHLFDFYVDRMMQRLARRESTDPTLHLESLHPDEDRPTRYSRQQVDRYLGWLAMCLIERSRTTFRFGGIYSLLAEKRSGRPWDILHATEALVVFMVSALLALLAVARIGGNALVAVALVLAVGAAGIAAYWCWLPWHNLDRLITNKALAKYAENILPIILLITWTTSFLAFVSGLALDLFGHIPLRLGDNSVFLTAARFWFQQEASVTGGLWEIGVPFAGALIGALIGAIVIPIGVLLSDWRQQTNIFESNSRLGRLGRLLLAAPIIAAMFAFIGLLCGWLN